MAGAVTVTILVAVVAGQLPELGTEYVIVAFPGATPVIIPEELTVATKLLSLVQVPPVPDVVNVVLPPTQTDCVPAKVPAVLQFVVVKEAPPGKIL
ncbi:MAG: hypothetical protein EBT80_09445 [Chitinophagales bacterium]|nr:hypothetical protein [Chitinophagales bacterium]